MKAQLAKQRVERLEEEFRFYALPDALADRMYAWHLQRLPDVAELPLLHEGRGAFNFGRAVSERLYRVLASMARAGAQNSDELTLRDALTQRLPVMLNLADPGEDAAADPPEAVEMCSEMVGDFLRWLGEEKDGVCVTGWGRIELRPDGDLLLVYTLPRYKRPDRRRQSEAALRKMAAAAGD